MTSRHASSVLACAATLLVLLCAHTSAQAPPIKKVCRNDLEANTFTYSCDTGTVFVKFDYAVYGNIATLDADCRSTVDYRSCKTPTLTTGTDAASKKLAEIISTACLGKPTCTFGKPDDPCSGVAKSLLVTLHCQARMFACVSLRGSPSLTFFRLN
jgi:hypothetical protein